MLVVEPMSMKSDKSCIYVLTPPLRLISMSTKNVLPATTLYIAHKKKIYYVEQILDKDRCLIIKLGDRS